MSEVKWTDEQLLAINEKNSNILVAAAAGSGKTAVLVERMINKVINEKVDIDKILIVTFTNAAASEMRERLLSAIYKKLDEMPEDVNLQKQIMLLNKASITTIDSFCLEVIRNNFYELDISANFRIGDQAEVELLKQEVLDDLFEEKYDNQDESFENLTNIYTSYRGDEPLKELILKIYTYIQSSPFPDLWLEKMVEKFNLKDEKNDFSNTEWGKVLLDDLKDKVENGILSIKEIKKQVDTYSEMQKFSLALGVDIVKLEELKDNLNNWDNAYRTYQSFGFDRWPTDKKVTCEIKDIAKDTRKEVKENIIKQCERVLLYDSNQAYQDLYEMYKILVPLKNLIIEFEDRFLKRKKEKNILDFNDIEHFALKLLVDVDENGNVTKTEIAKQYQDKFEEIAIDEYQDSNLVQEYILSSVSKNNNIFMVGDVKQSIYKFRQAMPQLFLDKYNTYKLKKDKSDNDNLKIQLFANFRSRENILNITNLIFSDIMSEKLGDINYTKEEYLNYFANYEKPQNEINYAGKSELYIIDKAKQNDEKFDSAEDEEKNDEEENNLEIVEDVVLEAKFVAKKIQELVNSDYCVWDKNKKEYRRVTYKDIVVLLRSTKVAAPIYEKEIANLDMPVFSDSSTDSLDTTEVQTIMAVLRIIDNPLQDISLVTVLRSCIGGFTDDDLVKIRVVDKNCRFYFAMKKALCQVDDVLKGKIEKFLEQIENWKSKEQYLSLDELIWQIYLDTNYYNYVSLMPNGELRQANLKMLFEKAKQYEKASFKGLFNFINFIEKLKLSSGDMGSAKIIGENENVVRLMSIHKSKGLEFPIVFLSSLGKQFNLMDLNNNILLHQEMGIGPKYINYDRKIEYSTLAKEAIRIKLKEEFLSEEMRVLYVALTRAKEKLILTGVQSDTTKSLIEKEKMLDLYKIESSKINKNVLMKYNSYLDWIELVNENNNKIKDELELTICDKDTVLNNNENQEIKNNNLLKNLKENVSKVDYDKVIKLLSWEYKDKILSQIPTKTSVTSIKNIKNENIEVNDFEKEMPTPKFLSQTEKITSSKKGTLMHLCIQRLKEEYNYTYEDIKNMINDLVLREIITNNEAESINVKMLYDYTKTEFYNNLKQAKLIKKEEPFYINVPIKEIYENDLDGNILVQGIIDLYFIDKNDKLVLVDYKTDYIEEGQEELLIKKYKSQLELYKRALESSLNRKVDKVIIYSLRLLEEIEI